MRQVLIVATGVPIALVKLVGLWLIVVGHELVELATRLDQLWFNKIVLGSADPRTTKPSATFLA